LKIIRFETYLLTSKEYRRNFRRRLERKWGDHGGTIVIGRKTPNHKEKDFEYPEILYGFGVLFCCYHYS